MKKYELDLNLKLFDGGVATPSAGEGGGSVNTVLQNLSKSAADNMQSGNVAGGGANAGAEGTDGNGADNADGAADNLSGAVDKDAEYRKLMKGEYKDIYKKDIQKKINERFKTTKTLEKQVSDAAPILDTLFRKYNIDNGDIAALSRAVQEDDSNFVDEAIKQGLTVDQLKERNRILDENARLKRMHDDIAAEQRTNEILNGWQQQADVLKSEFPDFDLETECENDDFARLLASGVTVKAAFQAVHFNEIASGVIKIAQQETKKAVTDNIKARNSRPVENGLSSASGAIFKKDVKSLTAQERADIARQVKEGRQISF